MKVNNWGLYPTIEATVRSFDDFPTLKNLLQHQPHTIARGLGRCYGDSALNTNIVSTLRFNRIRHFEPETGIICCESGVSLAELLETFVPKGWFLPVTPGTKFVTVGGAIAADVHGKNHHKEGTFSNHVFSLELMLADGSVVNCSREENPDLFWSTCGGMGLTGVILTVTFRLKPIASAYIRQESVKARHLEEIMALFELSEDWTYTVAWIDCLASGAAMGRSVLLRGEHAPLAELKESQQQQHPLQLPQKQTLNVPIPFPGFSLNSFSVKCFNQLYYYKYPDGVAESIIDYNAFFYPLDAIHNWNRIYGRKGFTQYQFVLPKAASKEGLPKILKRIAEQGLGSFLAVLKLFGKQEEGLIPFPMEGYTLALDFPIRRGLFEFLDELDRMVLDYGGRLYLAKDVRMNQEMFLQSYPNAETFIQQVRKLNPGFKFRSFQSQRIGVTS